MWWRTGATLQRKNKENLLPDISIVEFFINTLIIVVVADGNKYSHFKILNLFQNMYLLRVFYAFFGYIFDEAEKRLVEGTLLSTAMWGAWIVTVLQCLIEQEIRGGRRQELYADVFGASSILTVAQIVVQIRQFVESRGKKRCKILFGCEKENH